MRVLLLSTTTGYQLRAFDDAAAKLGFELVFATDHCDRLDDPWQTRAIPVKFYEEPKGLAAIERAARGAPFDGVLAVGDRPVALAALAAERLGLPGHPPAAARVTASKRLLRQALEDAGLPTPWFFSVAADSDPEEALARARFPCVVKPLALAGSRGVVRADDEAAFRQAFVRVRELLGGRDVRVQRNAAHRSILIEEYIPGDEFALEGVLTGGDLQALAVFDKPDPLEGPFFEETIYVTPSRLERRVQELLVHTVAAACRTIGLVHGAVHAEARLNAGSVFVLEVAARPIGGLCARALRFVRGGGEAEGAETVTLEELLLRHAVGEPVTAFVREARAAGVMMIPVPRHGYFKRVEGIEAARQVDDVEDIIITAKVDQLLVPLPEGSSYPGFIFARATDPSRVETALRAAQAGLRWVIERPIAVVP
jgi:predicted ATP-grasp superfamily ATP-dependent carboligase